MVKADAYGHGLERLIEVFAQHADELGVAALDEGLRIRSCMAPTIPIFLMSGEKDWGNREYLDAVRHARLIPAISSLDELRLLLDRVGPADPCRVELKLDTGMGRLGVQERELRKLTSLLRSSDNLRVVGIFTHFASSDEPDLGQTREQEARLREMLALIPEDLVQTTSIHSCNSGALMHRGLGQSDIAEGTRVVRPGVMLYGAAPSRFLDSSPVGELLTPVGRWTTSVIETRTLTPGDAVGYGGTWTVTGGRNVRVAVLAVGYADGFRRSLGNRGRVLIRGCSFPVIGRVSMDMISVLANERICVGDEVVLLGSQQGQLGSDTISVWELAEFCDTIPYEIWTGLGSRVVRVLAAGH
jgi:alanine racemase